MRIVDHLAVVLLAIVGLASLAVVLSKNAQTPQVIQASGEQFIAAIRAATGPVTGGIGGFG